MKKIKIITLLFLLISSTAFAADVCIADITGSKLTCTKSSDESIALPVPSTNPDPGYFHLQVGIIKIMEEKGYSFRATYDGGALYFVK